MEPPPPMPTRKGPKLGLSPGGSEAATTQGVKGLHDDASREGNDVLGRRRRWYRPRSN
jgi:hypothetical protein